MNNNNDNNEDEEIEENIHQNNQNNEIEIEKKEIFKGIILIIGISNNFR